MNINKQAMDIEKLAKNIDDALQQASQEYQCPERKFTIEEAIKISKIISTANEERLPLILDVFEKAGVHINGMDELEEWKALKDQGCVIDMEEFLAALTKDSDPESDVVPLKPKEFADICKQFNLKPSCAKRALNRKGYLKTTVIQGVTNYTVPMWIDGKVERRVVILKEAAKKAGAR